MKNFRCNDETPVGRAIIGVTVKEERGEKEEKEEILISDDRKWNINRNQKRKKSIDRQSISNQLDKICNEVKRKWRRENSS